MSTLTILAELQALIPPLSAEEYAQLEANILQDGCRDPLIVWPYDGQVIILDGHNRYHICTEHQREYQCIELPLLDLDAAKLWMIENQLGRRNLTPDRMHELRGKQYNLQKKLSRGGGDHSSAEAVEQKLHNDTFDDTATRLAKEHKVSRSTIIRDGKYADALDTIADTLGADVRQTVLAGDTKLTQDSTLHLADLARTDVEQARTAFTAIQAAPTVQAAKDVLAQHRNGIGAPAKVAPAPPQWIPTIVERLAPLATYFDLPLPEPVTPEECFNAVSFFIDLAVKRFSLAVEPEASPPVDQWAWNPPAFNPKVHKLKSVCKYGHVYPLKAHEDGSEAGLRTIGSGNCIACVDKANWERKAAKQAVGQ